MLTTKLFKIINTPIKGQ